MVAAAKILVAKSWLRSRLFVSCSTRCPNVHSRDSTLTRRIDGRIIPLFESTDVPLFLPSGRPFIVLPSPCQSLLVNRPLHAAARNFSLFAFPSFQLLYNNSNLNRSDAGGTSFPYWFDQLFDCVRFCVQKPRRSCFGKNIAVGW